MYLLFASHYRTAPYEITSPCCILLGYILSSHILELYPKELHLEVVSSDYILHLNPTEHILELYPLAESYKFTSYRPCILQTSTLDLSPPLPCILPPTEQHPRPLSSCLNPTEPHSTSQRPFKEAAAL